MLLTDFHLNENNSFNEFSEVSNFAYFFADIISAR